MSVRIELKPKAKLMELIGQRSCVYCGQVDDTLLMTADGNVCCEPCKKSKGDMECNEWIRSLKATDALLWNKLVDTHRLNSTPVANLIRRIRIEG